LIKGRPDETVFELAGKRVVGFKAASEVGWLKTYSFNYTIIKKYIDKYTNQAPARASIKLV